MQTCSFLRRGKAPRPPTSTATRRSVNPPIRIRAKEPNPYLFKIERKRHLPVLAHDFGKGSPCAKCDHKCPGLELHYWKDICLNCGCHLNDHLAALQNLSTDSSADIGRISQRPDKSVSRSCTGSGIDRPKDDDDEALDEIAVEPGRTLQLAKRFQDLVETPEQARYQDYAPSDLNAISWQTHNSPVKTASVEKADKSVLYDKLPNPTATKIVTVTSSAEASPADSCLDVDGYAVKDNKLRCKECRRVFAPGQTAIVVHDVEQTGSRESSYWHPHCFRCHKCRCLLKDNKCYAISGSIFCADHFAEVNGLPKCTACTGWIFDDEFVWSKSHAYHKNHFLCCSCKTPMEDEYVLHSGKALCSTCYFAQQGRICRACKSVIDPEEPLIENGLLAWHLNRSCFCCCVCHQLLDKAKFQTLGSKMFCDRNCREVFVLQLSLRQKARKTRAREQAAVPA